MFRLLKKTKFSKSAKTTLSHVDIEDTHVIKKSDTLINTNKGSCDPCLPCELVISALCLGCVYGIYSCAEDYLYNDCSCDPAKDCTCGQRNFGCF
jgi:hypothetical protein